MAMVIFFPQLQNSKMTNSIHNNYNNTASTFIRSRTTNPTTLLFVKAQSTISICVLLLFLTLLLFTLSTFEPSIPTPTIKTTSSRRFLWDYNGKPSISSYSASSFALQGMGTLYRRGTKSMNDIIVTHVVEDVTPHQLRLFLRLLHRSGATSKSDIVFLFGSSSLSSAFGSVIREENESFLKLVQLYKDLNVTGLTDSIFGFDSTLFWKSAKKDVGETIWGKKGRAGNYTTTSNSSESTWLTYGSVVGFDVNELDPENSLSGFFSDHVPMSLRRWACYPMLLGRVRRNFKHVMLLDVKNVMILGDPLVRVRNRSADSVYILTKGSHSGGKHNRRNFNSEKTRSRFQVNPAIMMGGVKGIRRLGNAMLTEIVRTTMQHKKKNSMSESGLLSQLVGNEYVLKNVNLVTWTSTVSTQEASSLKGLSTDSGGDYSIIQRGNSNQDLNSMIMELICSCDVDSSVYRDC